MAKKIGIVVAILIIALVGFIATRPDSFRVERSGTVDAPSDVVYAMLNDFHNWSAWSPWDKLDPNMKRSFDGAESGVGAGYAWVGNDEVGEGRMTIIGSKPSEQVDIKLEFLKPFAATNQTTFKIVPTGAGSQVTWSMEGKNNFMSKAFSTFMNMDSMIGKDFERGLANLAEVAKAESEKRKAAAQAEAPKEGEAPKQGETPKDAEAPKPE